MSTIKEHIRTVVNNSLGSLGLTSPQFAIERPKEAAHGDYSVNAAMMLAKAEKKNPKELALSVIDKMALPSEFIDRAQVAGPGFINFFVKDAYYISELESISKTEESLRKKSNGIVGYGAFNANEGKTAILEWVSANPTGPLHTGHGRQTALGKAIANLLEWSGYTLTREYYYNNAGKQIDNLAKSVYARYRQIFEPDFVFPEDGYVGEYIIEVANQLEKEHGDKLIDADSKVFAAAGEKWCFDSIKTTLARLGIKHDEFYNESSLYESGKINEALEYFKAHNLSYEKDGAVWLRTSELLKDKKDAEDKVIVKSTGEPTYRLPDMVYHADKVKRGFEKIVDIFGADHGDTYKEVLAGVAALGYDASKILVIIHQMVTFVQAGKPVKMSKRSDNVYYLDELLDDVGVDVAQFFFVMRSANTHLEFDIQLAKEQSDKNPVFYLQYAHARICGILRNAEEAMKGHKTAKADFSLLKNIDELNLMKELSSFPDIVEVTAATHEPHKIITYLNQAAECFHKFYHNNRVIDAENEALSYQRIKLCEATKIVLKNGFEIIGISAPERM